MGTASANTTRHAGAHATASDADADQAGPATDHPLGPYWAKRDFAVTGEPRGARAPRDAAAFVIQKHAASRLHYDFRLALDGVLVSWAVPKGPSLDPADKRLAIHVEDHPLSYGSFEGTIPPGQYGAGRVIVWDRGKWEPIGDPHAGLAQGKLVFRLHGEKLHGTWELVKIAKPGERQEAWLLLKKRDEHARTHDQLDIVAAQPDSVLARPLGPASGGPPHGTTRARSADRARPSKPAQAIQPAAAAGTAAAARGRPQGRGRGPGALPGAVKAALPDTLAPQLATLASGVPPTGGWIYEIKFDGYRLMTRIERGRPRLITRGGHDWSDRLPQLVDELGRLGLGSAWLDGEIVVPGRDGTPDFNALQRAFDHPGSGADIVYFLFDLPYLEGHDLRHVGLAQRRAALQRLVDERGSEHVRFSAAVEGDPGMLLQSACRLGMEGVIAKRADAPYVSRRSETWLKLKCRQRQEFVVCGYTDRSDGAPQIGSLVLGVHDAAGHLVSVGSVGTGWDGDEARQLKQALVPLERATPPFAAGPKVPGRWSRRAPGSERWVAPRLVVEVEFAEWTPDGQIRHASYIASRTDKPARAIIREVPRPIAEDPPLKTPAAARPATPAGIAVTHGERVIDATTGLTKLDLVRYYESVAAWMLPHLKDRPVALVRGPSGVAGELFFQKHDDKLSIAGMKPLAPDLWPGHPPLLTVPDAAALAGAAQMNVIEFHTWNSTARHIGKPDRMVLDLDPGEGTSWQHVQESALLVRTLLTELGLQAWLKTSGGKGLHVVVPLTPRLDIDAVRDVSRAIVQHLARTIPSRFVAKSGPANRVGKVFVDYLRNGPGATTAAAFSARARPGLGVSMPVAWDDLSTLKSGAHWTIATAREHLSLQSEDPWAGYWPCRQTLTEARRALGVAPARPVPRPR